MKKDTSNSENDTFQSEKVDPRQRFHNSRQRIEFAFSMVMLGCENRDNTNPSTRRIKMRYGTQQTSLIKRHKAHVFGSVSWACRKKTERKALTDGMHKVVVAARGEKGLAQV